MKFTQKEALLCVGGGVAVSLLIFFVAFFVQPTLLTNGGFMPAAGLLPMVLVTGFYTRHKSRQDKDNQD